MAARVDAATRARAGSPWDAAATAAAVRADSVEVVLTDSGREVPARAYTSVGTVATYRPTWTGSPAMVAYAMAWGMTTAAVVRPATMSPRSHAPW